MKRKLRALGPPTRVEIKKSFFNPEFIPWVVAGVALLVYVVTLCPKVWWISSGELIAAAEVLGIPHAPGAAPYVLLGRIFTLLFPVCPEWGVNLISALSAAFAVGAAVKLSTPDSPAKKSAPDKATLLATAFLMGSLSLWTQATVGERRTFLLALFAGALLAFKDYLKTSRASRLWLAFFILGVASAIRPNAPIFALGAGLFLFFKKRDKNGAIPALFLFSIVSFTLGFSVCLYLPLRFPMAPFCFSYPGVAHFFPWVREMMGLSFLSHLKPAAPVSLSGQLPGFVEALPNEFGFLGAFAVLAGLLGYFRFKDGFPSFLLLILGLDIATWIPFRPFGQGITHYALFSYFLLVPFMAFGIREILAYLRTPFSRIAVTGALAAAALLNGGNHWTDANRRHDFSASDYANACMAMTKNSQALFINYDNEYFPLLPRWYGKSAGPRELIFTGDYEDKQGVSWVKDFVEAEKQGNVFLGFRDEELEKRIPLIPRGPLYWAARKSPVLLEDHFKKAPPLMKFAGGIQLNQANLDDRGLSGSRLFALDFTWSKSARAVSGFWVEAFLVGKDGERLLGLFPPAYGLYPPALWEIGTGIHEREVFLLPSDVRPGSYGIRIALLPKSSVKMMRATPPTDSNTLYSEVNPFSKRYGGMAGSLARFQKVFSDPATISNGFLRSAEGTEPTILLKGTIQVAPDSPMFLLGPEKRGELSVVSNEAPASAKMEVRE